jgi:hypothetical protein
MKIPAAAGVDARDYAIDHIFLRGHTRRVSWMVEVTEQFERWWDTLSEDERVSIDGMIRILEARGPDLGAPFTSAESGSRYAGLRELRVPHQSHIICLRYATDEARSTLILLIGVAASSAAQEPCPPDQVEHADRIYAEYLARRQRPH